MAGHEHHVSTHLNYAGGDLDFATWLALVDPVEVAIEIV